MISEGSISRLRDEMLERLVESQTPTVYAMAGVPASGKSTFVANAQASGEFPRTAFVLNPDLVMIALPEYQQMAQEEGLEAAFEMFEMPARELAYALFAEAIERRVDVIKDMASARQENYEKLKELKGRGYRLCMFYIAVDPDEAIRRSADRSGRHTPVALIRERYHALELLLPKYRDLFDEFHAFDNNDQDRPYRRITSIRHD